MRTRNLDKHTSAEDAKRNILRALSQSDRPLPKAVLGHCAFPGYEFRTAQGQAFSVAKLVRKLEDAKLVRFEFGRLGMSRGYVLSDLGRQYVKDEHQAAPG